MITPGPWRVYRDGAFPAVVSGSDDNDTFRYVAQDMTEADARLIAQAPAMLAVLKALSFGPAKREEVHAILAAIEGQS